MGQVLHHKWPNIYFGFWSKKEINCVSLLVQQKREVRVQCSLDIFMQTYVIQRDRIIELGFYFTHPHPPQTQALFLSHCCLTSDLCSPNLQKNEIDLWSQKM